MLVSLEDFLRRRTKLALIEKKETLSCAKGMSELCQILFGKESEARYQEYFG